MATYLSIGISPAAFEADADFSNACAIYRFVTIASTNGKVKMAESGCNPVPLGVLQNSPCAAEAAEVTLLGPTILKARATACNLTFGKHLFSGSDGVAEPIATDTGSCVCAKWLGPTITSGSAYGSALFLGFATCVVSGS